VIHIIRPVGSTSVEIGICNDPAERLKTLQEAHPGPLELLAVFPGGTAEQQALRRLLDGHLNADWFEMGDADPVSVVEEILCSLRPGKLRRVPTGPSPSGIEILDISDVSVGVSPTDNSFFMAPTDFEGPRYGDEDPEQEEYDCRFSSGGQ